MTLTPEQFNLLVTKDDLNNGLNNLRKEIREDFNKVFEVLDVIVKQKKDQEIENIANQEAHTRINRDLLRVKEQAKIKGMEVVEQI